MPLPESELPRQPETTVHAPPNGTPTIFWADGGQSALNFLTGQWMWRDGSNGYQLGDEAHQLACNQVLEQSQKPHGLPEQ